MSVAFRRESDEAHLEPRFDIPLPPGPNLVTPRGLTLIEQRVAALEAGVRDLAPGEARDATARDLRYWRARLATAEVSPPAADDVVGFATRVQLRFRGRSRTIDIVGHDEADADGRRVAIGAPLARALIGLAAGDVAPFGGEEDAIELLAVAAIPDEA